MKLLTPREHKETTAKQDSKLLKEIGDIRDALEKGIRALNEFREHDKNERRRISKVHAEFVRRIGAGRDALELEVQSLESRKAEAMKPIKEIRQEAEATLESAKDREAEVDRKNKAVIEARKELTDKAIALTEKESELAKESRDLIAREEKLKKDESAFKSFVSMQYVRLNQERDRIRNLFEDLHKKSKNKSK